MICHGKELIKRINVCSKPVRAGKFIARQQWLITGSVCSSSSDSLIIDEMLKDDLFVRVFDLNTLECIKQFEGHADFIRSIVVHPTQPIVLTSGGTFDSKTYRSLDEWFAFQTTR